ncbi:YezD family protein [Novosphingobium lentum]|uniref:YezD family protein n=1 Tax=Novosphingobium lentum TaxID=145287 RepID=UPI000A009A42|nr:YezD family protein [Novosphingobium lentum]
MSLKPVSSTIPSHKSDNAPLDTVVEALGRMKYGVIQIVVHDGRLVQVDVTERRRFT